MVRSTEGLPTATIEDIPNELLDRICGFADVSTLKALRVSCKSFVASATRALFCHVELLPTKESAAKCRKILDSDILAPQVVVLAINTSLTPEDEDMDADGDWPKERKLPKGFTYMLLNIWQFTKLKHVMLRYSRQCVSEETAGQDMPISVPDTVRLRHSVLRKLCHGLNNKQHPVKLSSLAIKHMQNVLHNKLSHSKEFIEVLSGLSSLSLQIASQITDFADVDDNCPEPAEFFGVTLPTNILRPAANNLQHLTLYGNEEWGFWPYFDFRQLHFPNLTSLALGNFSLFCNAQLSWITSHAATLQVLILDNCFILTNSRVHDEPRSHAISGMEMEPDDVGDLIGKYATRWHDYFRAIAHDLHCLLHFGLEYDPCKTHRQLEERDQIGVQLRTCRYRVYDCFCHYLDLMNSYKDISGDPEAASFDSCWAGYMFGICAPQCDDEDHEALSALLDRIRGRAGGSDLMIDDTPEIKRYRTWERNEEKNDEVDQEQKKAEQEAE